MGAWEDDGTYVSLIRSFGGGPRQARAFLAYFREIDGATNHLIGGINQPLDRRWSAFVGRYPFNAWHAAVTYQLSTNVQVGLWVNDFGRAPRLGLSLGAGWEMGRRGRLADRSTPDGP